MGLLLFGSENHSSLTLKVIDLQGEIFIDISHYQPIGVYSDGHKWLPVVLCFMKRSAVRAYAFKSLQDAMTQVNLNGLREKKREYVTIGETGASCHNDYISVTKR